MHDRYASVWPKLASAIAHGEKERALGMFLLLSRTLKSSGVRLQLQGDILLACGDKAAAVSAYQEAAQAYRLQEPERATAVLEHISTLMRN